ncbi:MAG: hypothetical protein GY804_07205, partial [Alphaproteobacteria bacterium]|nr:hypothetical protein [Alphaproteobacteria bacterium]
MKELKEKNKAEKKEREEEILGLRDSFVRKISKLIDDDTLDALHDECIGLSAVDMAELMEKLDHKDRVVLLETLETELDPETFAEFESDVLNDLLDHLSPSNIAKIINELDSDDAIG